MEVWADVHSSPAVRLLFSLRSRADDLRSSYQRSGLQIVLSKNQGHALLSIL